MGEVEDEDAGVLDRVLKGGVCDDVGREGDVGEVFDVFVEVVDQSRELVLLG